MVTLRFGNGHRRLRGCKTAVPARCPGRLSSRGCSTAVYGGTLFARFVFVAAGIYAVCRVRPNAGAAFANKLRPAGNFNYRRTPPPTSGSRTEKKNPLVAPNRTELRPVHTCTAIGNTVPGECRYKSVLYGGVQCYCRVLIRIKSLPVRALARHIKDYTAQSTAGRAPGRKKDP